MFELLDNVFATGKAFVGREIGVKLQNQARESLIERIVNFVYQPIFESDGSVSGIFVHGVDVTDQVQARKDAEKANRAKDEFLATLSHELRTPLNSILGWVTMLRNQQLDDDTKEKAIEIIQRNARLQSQLIEDVLDVSRIISGKLRLEVEPIDLASIVTSAIETVTPAANAKEIRVEAVLDPNIGQVTGDPNRLRQAVWNLLTNAVKFTPASGRVDVRLNRAGSNIELIVVDTGVGISPEVLPHVFERFRQANSAISRMHGGLGLGLAIVRHLVEMHGGTVRAESAGENSGAAFTITLPLVRADREEPADEIQSGLPAADTTE
jgi:signal transduction histidine kinase